MNQALPPFVAVAATRLLCCCSIRVRLYQSTLFGLMVTPSSKSLFAISASGPSQRVYLTNAQRLVADACVACLQGVRIGKLDLEGHKHQVKVKRLQQLNAVSKSVCNRLVGRTSWVWGSKSRTTAWSVTSGFWK